MSAITAALQLLEAAQPSHWADDPVGWATHKLDDHLWSIQRDIAQSVVTNPRTAVKACHGLGKSYLASRIALW